MTSSPLEVYSTSGPKFKDLNVESKFILIALGLSLATGKWGSYVGFTTSSIFVIDLIFLTGCLKTLLNKKTYDLWFICYTLPIFLFILIWIFNSSANSFVLVVRDLSPFVYLLFLPMVKTALQNVKFSQIINILRIASLFHLFWLIPKSIGVLNPIVLPISTIPIFADRYDHSGLVMAIGIYAWSSFEKHEIKANFFVMSCMFLGAGLGYSRAGFIATLMMIGLLLIQRLKSPDVDTKRNVRNFLILGTGLLILISLLSAIDIPKISNSAIARLGLFSSSEMTVNQAAGTIRGRNNARELLLNWLTSNDKLIGGAGPGTEIVSLSGALAYLSGNESVRSPHNWFLTLLGRYGLFGITFWLLLYFWPLRKLRTKDDLYFMSSSISIIILITSLMGVIIESPFGSMPLTIFLAIAAITQNKPKNAEN